MFACCQQIDFYHQNTHGKLINLRSYIDLLIYPFRGEMQLPQFIYLTFTDCINNLTQLGAWFSCFLMHWCNISPSSHKLTEQFYLKTSFCLTSPGEGYFVFRTFRTHVLTGVMNKHSKIWFLYGVYKLKYRWTNKLVNISNELHKST